ncbi:tRNA A-37 threonylcarbamoyl transferase component Bud32 [Nocardioides zeae]|uniref:tRNA A-37 threonylcarbamoyl transferase component Bud32 n=1 Tax=Nocardioides zeae TaxID=1457234 RepID=A0ACC6IMA6_9ACTN|nr:protein kinase [Nocardioides zeae]MDR6173256.1 tRNA A-37 threonylcarbamoyl transferase component Bud32 [Nocardioides zeae]MDR6211803.1 tRNA A-37 threonylcarbamoyl transferase component Bud32 [Nocardioides zeae]
MTRERAGDSTDGAWRPPAAASEPAAPRREPEDVPGYVELTEVGRGGDSVVYRARQVSPHRVVAIKVLGTDDDGRVARFRREVDITIELGRQHPHIVNLLDVGTTGAGRPFLVMDFVEAGTVHDRLRQQGPLPVHEILEIGYVLADALAFAHERGVLHRDVKPQNVLVLPTTWVLADFGIARLAGSEHTASVETFTYRHAAPQVLDGEKPSQADDLWSLGSTLFTLLDGRPPFASDDPDEDSALAYIRRARTEPHRQLSAEGAERVAEVIDRCLQKDPAQRWPDAASLRDAFAALRTSAWLPGGGQTAPASPSPTPTSAGAPSTASGEGTAPRPVSPAPAIAPVPVDEPAPQEQPVPREQPVPAAAPAREDAWAPGADPEPLALSVLAHAPVQHEPDAAPTGTGGLVAGRPTGGADAAGPPRDTAPPAGTVPAAEPTPDPASDPARRRRRNLLVLLAVVALLVGMGLTIVGSALRGDGEPREASPADTTPTAGGGVPTATETPAEPDLEPRPNPDLAVLFTDIDAVGLDIEMAWTDPSEGEAEFYVAQTSGPEGTVVDYQAVLPPGTRQYVLPGALAAGGRQCYAILLRMPTGEFGVSDVRCITAPAADE